MRDDLYTYSISSGKFCNIPGRGYCYFLMPGDKPYCTIINKRLKVSNQNFDGKLYPSAEKIESCYKVTK